MKGGGDREMVYNIDSGSDSDRASNKVKGSDSDSDSDRVMNRFIDRVRIKDTCSDNYRLRDVDGGSRIDRVWDSSSDSIRDKYHFSELS